jgi:RHS repeat-associated protein
MRSHYLFLCISVPLLASLNAAAKTTVTYIHSDILGSVIAKSNVYGRITERTDYEAYGEQTNGQKAGIGYTGHLEAPELGLTYMQQRYYDPSIGRFYSNDPVDMLGHMQRGNQTMGFNRYAYAKNNPYKYTDPDGRAEMYTWNAGPKADGTPSRAGHAATRTEDGSYVSKFPTDGNGSKAEFRTYEQDVADYGREPDVIVQIALPDEGAANIAAKEIINDDSQTWSVNNNCADAAVGVVNAGGANIFSGGIQSPASVDANLRNAAKTNENITIIKDE